MAKIRFPEKENSKMEISTLYKIFQFSIAHLLLNLKHSK